MDHSDLLALLARPAPEVAPRLLGALLGHRTADGLVTVRITEIEAYGGPAGSDLPDPGAHTYGGRTARNASMFGPPGHVYVYFTYGMHHAVNVVCRPRGLAGGCLVRAGEVVEGLELARARRSRATPVADEALARGPGNLAKALGIHLAHDGAPLATGDRPGAHGPAHGFFLRPPVSPAESASGPRTGVSGPGGTPEYPWRWWIPGEPTVSPYRRAVARRRG